jgi:hypothetical protein
MKRVLPLLLLLLTGCASVDAWLMRQIALEKTDPNTRISEDFLARSQTEVFDVWAIPGLYSHYLVWGEQPGGTAEKYGRQFFVVRLNDDESIDVLFESQRMMDVEFFEPEFYPDDTDVLVLANTGAEDSWELAAFVVSKDSVRDLGGVPVIKPATVEFYESALPAVHVSRDERGYVLEFDGPVLDSSAEQTEPKTLAKKGERAVFVLKDERFVLDGVR